MKNYMIFETYQNSLDSFIPVNYYVSGGDDQASKHEHTHITWYLNLLGILDHRTKRHLINLINLIVSYGKGKLIKSQDLYLPLSLSKSKLR